MDRCGPLRWPGGPLSVVSLMNKSLAAEEEEEEGRRDPGRRKDPHLLPTRPVELLKQKKRERVAEKNITQHSYFAI